MTYNLNINTKGHVLELPNGQNDLICNNYLNDEFAYFDRSVLEKLIGQSSSRIFLNFDRKWPVRCRNSPFGQREGTNFRSNWLFHVEILK